MEILRAGHLSKVYGKRENDALVVQAACVSAKKGEFVVMEWEDIHENGRGEQ